MYLEVGSTLWDRRNSPNTSSQYAIFEGGALPPKGPRDPAGNRSTCNSKIRGSASDGSKGETRAQVVTDLEDIGFKILDHVPQKVVPPVIIMGTGDPYVEVEQDVTQKRRSCVTWNSSV